MTMTTTTGTGTANPGSVAPGFQRQGEAAAPFAVSIIDGPQGALVRLEGEANLTAVDQMQFALMRLIARRLSLAVLDLSGLTFLSSLGMGVLVRFRRDLARWGGRVLIAGVRPNVYESLQLTGLVPLFEFCATVEETVAAS
jgi:anti-anti-sigma factor